MVVAFLRETCTGKVKMLPRGGQMAIAEISQRRGKLKTLCPAVVGAGRFQRKGKVEGIARSFWAVLA